MFTEEQAKNVLDLYRKLGIVTEVAGLEERNFIYRIKLRPGPRGFPVDRMDCTNMIESFERGNREVLADFKKNQRERIERLEEEYGGLVANLERQIPEILVKDEGSIVLEMAKNPESAKDGSALLAEPQTEKERLTEVFRKDKAALDENLQREVDAILSETPPYGDERMRRLLVEPERSMGDGTPYSKKAKRTSFFFLQGSNICMTAVAKGDALFDRKIIRHEYRDDIWNCYNFMIEQGKFFSPDGGEAEVTPTQIKEFYKKKLQIEQTIRPAFITDIFVEGKDPLSVREWLKQIEGFPGAKNLETPIKSVRSIYEELDVVEIRFSSDPEKQFKVYHDEIKQLMKDQRLNSRVIDFNQAGIKMVGSPEGKGDDLRTAVNCFKKNDLIFTASIYGNVYSPRKELCSTAQAKTPYLTRVVVLKDEFPLLMRFLEEYRTYNIKEGPKAEAPAA